MKKTLLILNIIALIVSIAWLLYEQTFEPLITTIGLIATLISIIFSNKDGEGTTIMKQKGGKQSTNYQAKGDINL